MSTRDRVTDEQWELIERILLSPSVRSDGRGRPWKNNREVLNGIIWILRSGARWKDLPRDFPSHQTCHRRFQQWVTDGTLRKILEVLARDLEERGEIDLQECFIDGSFSGAKKGGLGVAEKQRFFLSESLLCSQNSLDQSRRGIRLRTNSACTCS